MRLNASNLTLSSKLSFLQCAGYNFIGHRISIGSYNYYDTIDLDIKLDSLKKVEIKR